MDDRSNDKLKRLVKEEVTKLFTTVLDYVEVAVDGKDRYQNLRSKILKVSNDTIRHLGKEIDSKYKVQYVATTHDLIVVDSKKA